MTNKQIQAILLALEHFSNSFWGPDPLYCSNIRKPNAFGWADSIIEISHRSLKNLIDQTVTFVSSYNNAQDLFEDLEAAYVSIFVNSREGIVAPLYHSCYETPDNIVMGPPAVYMMKRLRELGLSIRESYSHEPPDHISIELEFLYSLILRCLKEEHFRQEASSFAIEFMLPWVTNMCHRLDEVETVCPFYPLTARKLSIVLKLIKLLA